MSKALPVQANIEYLKNEAKDLLKSAQQGQAAALHRIKSHHPRLSKASDAQVRTSKFSLQECQLVLAREYGFDTWSKLVAQVSLMALRGTMSAAIRSSDQEKAAKVLQEQSELLPVFLQEKNQNRYSNWFSGKDATILQMTAFLRPALSPALLQAGAEVDFHSACALGDLAVVERLLAADPAVLQQPIDSYYPIQYAIRHLSAPHGAQVLRYLLEHGDDPNRPLKKMAWFEWEDQAADKGISDWRPIHMLALQGANKGSIAMAKLLKEFGADLNAASSPFGETALHLAAIYDGSPLIRWLVENGVDVDVGSVDTGHRAAAADLFDMAPYMPFQTHEQTPLMLALGEGQGQAVRSALLELGADINARDDAGFTPLHYAAGAFWQEKVEHVQMLLERGAAADATDQQGRRPIDLARAKNYQATIDILT